MLPSRVASLGSPARIVTGALRSLTRGLRWSVERDPEALKSIRPASEIVRESEIHEVIAATRESAKDPARVREILARARERALLKHVSSGEEGPASEYVQGLSLEEAATLLNIDSGDEDLMEELFATALDVKRQIYGNRIVLFAPLYLANYCVNTCTYCAFRGGNKHIERSRLTDEQLVSQVQALERQGHRRLLLLTGEHPKYTFDEFLRALKLVDSVKTEPCGNIRRINVEIPSLSVSDFRRLKETDVVGTYTLFQETYHRPSFRHFHTAGPKSDYDHRLQTMDRAQLGGIDDVGIGALFGLYDYRFEVLAMLQHAEHLDATYGAGPHTISIPRIRPADNAPDAEKPPMPVADGDFRKLVAVIRCAVPYTGMILSTRESPSIRRQLLHLGVSQMSAGSRTEVGAYTKGDQQAEYAEGAEKTLTTEGQFELLDHRPLDSVVGDLMQQGFVPSWCTACYRAGRTGEAFMKIAKRGDIKYFCHPNALLTLKEYLDDYASPGTRELGARVMEDEAKTIDREGVQRAYARKLARVAKGERDLYF